LAQLLIERSFDRTRSAGPVVLFFRDAGFTPTDARLAWAFAVTYISGRLNVESHLRGTPAEGHRDSAFTSEDYVAYGVEAVIAGIRGLREAPAARRTARRS
jgi:hypothetical protein